MTAGLRHLCACGALAVLLAGCSAPATRVVLLPQPGKSTAVEVGAAGSADRPAVLDMPYAQATVYANHNVNTEQLNAEAVQKRYRQLLSVHPTLPERFTLYFMHGTSSLTPDSLSDLDNILSRATTWPGSDIVITGHTDRVGSVELNDQLSLQRALAIRELVLLRGFDPARVEATGRGEREPVIPTEDEVHESRNRRAEIVVR